MPSFEFTSPEGKKYTVAGPDGATKEQAFQILQQQIAGGTAQAAAPVADPRMAGVPGYDSAGLPAVKPTAPADPSFVQKLIGGGETALALATGATSGTLGMVGGALKGLATAAMNGGQAPSSASGIDPVEQSAANGMQALTYQPRTQAGQDYTQAAGDAINSVAPLLPMAGEMSALGAGAKAAAQGARDLAPVARAGVATAVGDVAAAAKAATPAIVADAATTAKTAAKTAVAKIKTTAPAIAARVERTLKRNPIPDEPTPGTQGSVGAAATDAADLRRQQAADLPVPIKLTAGQAKRDFEQQRFEREMSKDPTNGEPLRDRYAQQNEDIMKNFDSWVDQTGAEAPTLRSAGQVVNDAIVNKAKQDKTEIRVAYKEAEKAGEMEDPVTLSSLVDHLNDSAPDAATAPLLDVARRRAIQLGIATEGGDGTLAAAPVTLKTAETMRQAIGRATDYEATNVRQSSIIKGLIDSETQGAGGSAYQAARRLRENYAKQYEDRSVVSSLLNNKRGTSDRKVALEDVFQHSILKSSLDDVRHVRRVLQTGGEQGQQAWRELQGQTINHIKNEATKNVATDTRGNPIVSADKMNKAIRALDADGKLDFIFGKKGAEQVRDINELSKAVFTAPPGSVNTSNTASVLMAALAEAGATGAFTGVPVPVLSGLRLIAQQVKNRKIQAKIEQALRDNRPAPNKPRAKPKLL